ncbi:glycosyltransferase family 2 protein [bacterium]|nr:glycosyltransferase family 2 protein [bacterium]
MRDLKENTRVFPADKINNNAKIVSIIIVSFNSRKFLKNCIDSIIKFPPDLSGNEFEIIVIDNNSSDGSPELVEKNYLKYDFVKLIKNDSNKGFSYANNIAIKGSNSKYFLLLNSDTEVYENSINGLVEFFEDSYKKGLNIGIAGPKIINSDGSIQLSCRRFPSFLNAAVYTILASIKPDNRFSRKYKLADADRNMPFEVDWVSGSAMMIASESLKITGIFDENYFMYVEDVDLCYRMWRKGFKVYYYPLVKVLHHVGGSGENNTVLSQVRMQKSVLYFYIKTYKKTWKIILIPLVFPVLGFRILMTYLKNINKKSK